MNLFTQILLDSFRNFASSAKKAISELLATDAEYAAGTASDKAATVAQVKQDIATAMDSVGSVTGAFKGAADTFADLPSGAKNGDWAVLRVDDDANESGIYVKASGGWDYVMDIGTINEVEALICSSTDVEAILQDPAAAFPALAPKLATVQVSQMIALYAAQSYAAQKNGSLDNRFSVAPPQQPSEAIPASVLFGDGSDGYDLTPITATQAQIIWDTAVVGVVPATGG